MARLAQPDFGAAASFASHCGLRSVFAFASLKPRRTRFVLRPRVAPPRVAAARRMGGANGSANTRPMINSAIPINCGWGSAHPAGPFLPSVRAGRKFLNRIKLILAVQPCLKKYFGFHLPQITSRTFRIPSHTEGRFAIVTDVGAGCGGRGSVLRAMGLQGESKDL